MKNKHMAGLKPGKIIRGPKNLTNVGKNDNIEI